MSQEESTVFSHSFVTFSQNLCSLDNVKQALLRLEKSTNLNVSVMLYLLWFATSSRGRLQKRDLTSLWQEIHLWYESVVLPLQRTTTLLTERGSAKLAELFRPELQFAEQIAQSFLTHTLGADKKKRNGVARLKDACHNIILYCKSMQIGLNTAGQQDCVECLRVVFNERSVVEIQKILTETIKAAHLEAEMFAQLPLGAV